MRLRRSYRWSLASAAGVLAASALAARVARAQRFETKHALTVVVGTPPAPAPQDRVDGARTGRSSTPLPLGTLRIAWRKNLSDTGSALALGGPLVNDRGETIVSAPRGDVFVVAEDGTLRAHVAVGEPLEGHGVLLADGSIVVLGRSGDVIGVRGDEVRFRATVGADAGVAPLALEDGGLVVATRGELVTLDAEGNVRARARLLDEADPVASLVGPRATAEGPVLYAITASGALLAWPLAASRELSLVGSFGGAVDGNAALVAGPNGATALGVVEHAVLIAVDLERGTSTPLAAATTAGAIDLLGPPAITPQGEATILALSSTRTLAVTLDRAGTEKRRQSVAPTSLPPLPDGGTAATPVPPHVGPLVDARGSTVFALPSGEVGALSASGSLDMTERVCGSRPNGARQVVAGLAPAGPAAVVVACEASYLVRVEAIRPSADPAEH